jgi:geranylgeranyl diphosphate synthase type II
MTQCSSDKTIANAFDLKAYLATRRQVVDQALQRFLEGTRFREETRLVAAMKYSINAGGKRLRPIICLASAHAAGGKENDALPMGCALEMIHTYSLIHDDLPAMDDDDFRRGKPTCHKVFGEATAILAGDALLTSAFQLLAEYALHQEHQQAVWVQVMAMIAKAAGHEGMIEGQMRDMAAEGQALSAGQLEELHGLKTGALITAAIKTGAVIGGADERALFGLEAYGRRIGLAFQVADDILNETGDPHVMGKAVGTDQMRQKSTYPALMGLEGARRMAAELVTEALRSIEIFDSKADPLRAIARYVIERQR